MSGWQGDRQRIPERTRRSVLARDPVCACGGCSACSRHGCPRPSTEADHDPFTYRELVRAGVSDPNTEDRLRGKCSPCHRVKSSAEQKAGVARMTYRRKPMKHPGEMRR